MPDKTISPSQCPLCGADNRCGHLAQTKKCWCFHAAFPKEIFELIPPEQRRKACICQACLERFSKKEKYGDEIPQRRQSLSDL
ncbi:cysteine-rich CWC family protein [Brevibacillus reuszeri]|uniref:cysteine-rich CWC family protein n=1 Tax=Brevibacillus reuszeri TaxID=54915 RepID=UPI000673A83B|nr:cysteine-rich CWC family protein [Brevibacillus reuszeri]MED1861319.1 cysteine-rich CWC family protein [Brevibacillus reuszeri]